MEEDLSAARVCKMRVNHLAQAEENLPQFERKRMDRMLVEHCFRCGYYDTASLLAKKSGVEVSHARVPRCSLFHI